MGTIDWVLGSVVTNKGVAPVVTGTLLNGTPNTIWSNTFRLGNSSSFGAIIVCTGTPVVQVQLEESCFDRGLNGITEGAASIYYVVPDAFPDIFPQINDTYFHISSEPVTPIPMTFGRFKVNGLAGNGSNTTVAIGLFRQEPGRFL